METMWKVLLAIFTIEAIKWSWRAIPWMPNKEGKIHRWTVAWPTGLIILALIAGSLCMDEHNPWAYWIVGITAAFTFFRLLHQWKQDLPS